MAYDGRDNPVPENVVFWPGILITMISLLFAWIISGI